MTANLTGFPPDQVRRLIVKVGSSLLVAPDGSVRRDWLASLVAELSARREAGQQIVVVSSGAIALGARRLSLSKGGARHIGRCSGVRRCRADHAEPGLGRPDARGLTSPPRRCW